MPVDAILPSVDRTVTSHCDVSRALSNLAQRLHFNLVYIRAMALAVETASLDMRTTTASAQLDTLEDKLAFLEQQRQRALDQSARFAMELEASMERLSCTSSSSPVSDSWLSDLSYYQASSRSTRRSSTSSSACGYSSGGRRRSTSSRRKSTLSDSCVHC